MNIFKYEIPIEDNPKIRLPRNATILHLGSQNSKVYLWAEINPAEEEVEEIELAIYGTGHMHWHKQGKFIGTVQHKVGIPGIAEKELVWHIYKIKR